MAHDFLRERGEVAGDGDKRTSGRSAGRADRVRRCHRPQQGSDAAPKSASLARTIVGALNPDAASSRPISANVPLSERTSTGRFDLEKAQQHPLWFKELHGFAGSVPETEEYGIRSSSIAPGALPSGAFNAFSTRLAGVIRAKGIFWLATRPNGRRDQRRRRHGANRKRGLLVVRRCRGPMARSCRMESKHEAPLDSVWGDRRQEIVFIGTDMNQQAMRRGSMPASSAIPAISRRMPGGGCVIHSRSGRSVRHDAQPA